MSFPTRPGTVRVVASTRVIKVVGQFKIIRHSLSPSARLALNELTDAHFCGPNTARRQRKRWATNRPPQRVMPPRRALKSISARIFRVSDVWDILILVLFGALRAACTFRSMRPLRHRWMLIGCACYVDVVLCNCTTLCSNTYSFLAWNL